MRKFFKEFKAFITRGNVIDMAVGVIVGGAFTAIVTALTNQIFKPLVNWALSGADGGLEQAVTMLKVVRDDTGAIDMTKSIYIDWGAFITAVLNYRVHSVRNRQGNQRREGSRRGIGKGEVLRLQSRRVL